MHFLCGGCFCAEMVEERSKHPLKLSEKLADVYKVQKKGEKNVKKACKVARHMVLYLSAKR